MHCHRSKACISSDLQYLLLWLFFKNLVLMWRGKYASTKICLIACTASDLVYCLSRVQSIVITLNTRNRTRNIEWKLDPDQCTDNETDFLLFGAQIWSVRPLGWNKAFQFCPQNTHSVPLFPVVFYSLFPVTRAANYCKSKRQHQQAQFYLNIAVMLFKNCTNSSYSFFFVHAYWTTCTMKTSECGLPPPLCNLSAHRDKRRSRT